MNLVEANAVTKSYGSFQALKGVSLIVPQGACFGLLGPNGAGKSTMIRVLYGATARSGGNVRVMGLDPSTQGHSLRRQLGVVTQEDALDDAMDVRSNMIMFARFLGIEKAVAARRTDELLEFMSLTAKGAERIGALSGGMKRRLVFVRALLSNPRLVILDEPTTGLDPAVRQLLWERIRKLKAEGTTVLLTTHYMDEAETLCDELVIMDEGLIKAEGAPKQLIRKHCPGYIAIFRDGTDRPETLTSESLSDLALKVEQKGKTPEAMRPSSLEDVFLLVTGHELKGDA